MTTIARHNLLLGTTAAAALLGLGATSAHAQTLPAGGGSSLASPTYQALFRIFQPSNPTVDFSDVYTVSGSGAAQTAVITNTPNASGGPTPFDFAASDATISDAQLKQWNAGGVNPAPASMRYGAPVEGALVEVPTIGTPITVPTNLAGVTANGSVRLTDADLCGIFSGNLTNYAQLTDAGASIPPGNGAIKVVFRSDGSGTSFLFTQHLAAVCGTITNTVGNRFFATTSFSSLFNPPGMTVPVLPSNFTSGAQSSGVQQILTATPGAVGYLSPDYTREIALPTLASGVTAAPFVAFVNGIEPTTVNTQNSLATGTPIPDLMIDPSGALFRPADPNSFVPVAANPPASTPTGPGYPIVGYTTFLLPQCYADPNVAAAIKSYIGNLYRSNAYTAAERASGFTPVPAALSNRISATYLTGAASSLISSVGATGCTASGLVGR